jgi:hypothetical protein
MVVHPQGETKTLAEMCPSPPVPPIRPEPQSPNCRI